MKYVSAAEFKAKCLKLMDEVQAGGEPITVTKRGKPVVTLLAAKPPGIETEPGVRSLFGAFKGSVTVLEGFDETTPGDPNWEAEWDAKWDRLGFAAPGKAGS